MTNTVDYKGVVALQGEDDDVGTNFYANGWGLGGSDD